MMFGDAKRIKFSNGFLNLTNKPICVYAFSSGNIVMFPPVYAKMRLGMNMGIAHPEFYYAVDASEVEGFEEWDRVPDNIAVVRGRSTGRGGVEIANLGWARNPDIKVVLREPKLGEMAVELAV